MSRIRNYNFDLTTVSAIVNNGEAMWVAFEGSSNICKLNKLRSFDLNQILYELTPSVTKITRMLINGTDLYAIADDSINVALKYEVDNPLDGADIATYAVLEANIPGEITEKPIALTFMGSNLYVLFPGNTSGENTKIVKYTSNLSFDDFIDLNKSGEVITDAISITNDGTNLWVVTNESPAKLVKIWETSGGVYDFESYIIL